MQIHKINRTNQSFTAQTKNENNYNKTSAGKGLGLGIAAGILTEKVIEKGSFKEFAKSYHQELADAISTEIGTPLNGLNTPLLKRMATRNLYRSVAIILIAGLFTGAIFDEIINMQRRRIADGKAV